MIHVNNKLYFVLCLCIMIFFFFFCGFFYTLIRNFVTFLKFQFESMILMKIFLVARQMLSIAHVIFDILVNSKNNQNVT